MSPGPGGAGATVAPETPFQAAPGPRVGSLGRAWPSLSKHPLGRTMELWSFGSDLKLSRDSIQSVGSSTLPGHHSTLLLWGEPLAPIRLPLGLSGALLKLFCAALLERPRCNFGMFSICLAFGHVFLCSREGGVMCAPYMQAYVS